LGFYGEFDQLGPGKGDEGEGRGLLEIQAFRNGRQYIRFGDGVFGIGAVCHRHDAHSLGEPGDAAAGLNDFVGQVAPQDRRQLDRHARFGGPLGIFKSMGLMLVARTRTNTSFSPYSGRLVSWYRRCSGPPYS
jgi:hypothetical protein